MKPETAAECLLRLAERETDCPDLAAELTDNLCQFCKVHQKHSLMCELCHDTGRVPTFPTLRRECAGYHLVDEELIKGQPQITTYACNEVGCPGWVATGRVAMFPRLRMGCECCQDPDDPCYCGAVCEPCQGRGWIVAEVHLEDILEAGRQSGYGINVITLGSEHPLNTYYRAWCGGQQGDGTVAEEAALRALVAAIQAQEGQG